MFSLRKDSKPNYNYSKLQNFTGQRTFVNAQNKFKITRLRVLSGVEIWQEIKN
tara:strand:+ start:190120 stop:190278 length:159 start_codon:yes stop_codon:yes gene_type:complete